MFFFHAVKQAIYYLELFLKMIAFRKCAKIFSRDYNIYLFNYFDIQFTSMLITEMVEGYECTASNM